MTTALRVLAFAVLALVATSARAATPTTDTQCASLARSSIGDATITAATRIDGGKLGDQTALPFFCRVEAIARPIAGSEIGVEVWLPYEWNGRYQQVGNGGFAGSIPIGSLASALRHGYLTAGTDDGHRGDSSDASWAHGHPERLIDYGTRAVRETRGLALAVARRLYGRPPAHSYFSGCSDGGREALITAQRFPQDFDGWLVGAPANDWNRLSTAQLSYSQQFARGGLGPAQLALLAEGALKACGDRAGVIADPSRCGFTPAALACKPGAASACLTPSQVAAAAAIYYGGPRERKSTAPLPGLYGTMGTEELPYQWLGWFGSDGAFGSRISASNFRDAVYDDPTLDLRTLDPARALVDGQSKTDAILAAIDPDLRRVRDGGKKIIQYHGWADAAISPEFSLRYLEAVQHRLGGDVSGFHRLFMIPGMGHCGGGPGANSVIDAGLDPKGVRADAMDALVAWVERGTPPQSLIAIGRQHDDPAAPVDRVATLCVYPGAPTGRVCPPVRRRTR